MNAVDGAFDEVIEEVIAILPAYTESGLHSIFIRGEDFYGNVAQGECIFLPVYDPSGGFVTGGGWINSPAGAYAGDTTLSGKASFGFVAKYKKGATEPTGNTEFQFKAGDLNFKSNYYDWLVIAGAKAMYKGTGTINGKCNYGFMISAVDGDLNDDADTFRIKIWDKNNNDVVVYDNQMGATDDSDPDTNLGGGNIVVHKG
jgi:hypothetical protein